MQDIVTNRTSNDTSKLSQLPSLDSLKRTTFAKFRCTRSVPISGTAKYARFAVNFLNKVEGLQATVREGAAKVTTEPSTVPFAPLFGLIKKDMLPISIALTKRREATFQESLHFLSIGSGFFEALPAEKYELFTPSKCLCIQILQVF
jgi:hypothetical protein